MTTNYITEELLGPFSKCECSLRNKQLLIHSFYPLEIINERLACPLTLKWVEDQTNLKIKDIINALELNKLIFSFNSSHFPDKPTLIATHVIITSDAVKLRSVNFISSAAPYCRNVHAVELYGILSIMKLLEYIILSNKILLNRQIILVIYSNYSIMIQFILISLLFIPFTSPICQIKMK